jgi:hypothetical protein
MLIVLLAIDKYNKIRKTGNVPYGEKITRYYNRWFRV